MNWDDVRTALGQRYGVLAASSTHQLTVIALDSDVAIGDLFLLPCQRGPDRFYVFRTTEYSNVMNRTLELNDVARNKLTMPDSYFSEDLADEKLVELRGMVLGYAEHHADSDTWRFHRPRRLPQHLSDVFHVDPSSYAVGRAVRELLETQLGADGLFVGYLLAGEAALPGAPVGIPPYALSHHIGIFGRTGCGKSNLMMVLLRSVFEQNRSAGPGSAKVSIFAIDPHDEFRSWHAATGGASGVAGLVDALSPEERSELVDPFYYLSARDIGDEGVERRVYLSRADLTPGDLVSVMEFSEQQIAFARQFYDQHGEQWVGRLLAGDTDGAGEDGAQYLPGTIAAVQRRVGFLSHGSTRIFTRFAPDLGLEFDYRSLLPDILCALERGRCLIVDTTLMGELEQFLLNTVVARALFALRRALRASATQADLLREIRQGFANDDDQGRTGSRTLADELVARVESGDLPYMVGGVPRPPDQLPYVNIVVEEAPSILNPQRMRFGSVFRDISRQGRKFGIGLTLISQQVSEIDKGVLTQLNTELTLALGNADERREAVRNASADLGGFAQELQVLGRGQAILSTSFRDVALPIQVPNYDDLTEGVDNAG